MKKYILVFILGFIFALSLNAVKVWTFSQQFTDPVGESRCPEWEDRLYWDVEHWNFDFMWKCGHWRAEI